ncbi:retinoblastoma-associated protein-like isoform X2 [Littorina saxatilis]|uniref:Uncharacterized protein n=1 Tax=Littorina saxatilis TaxID=31220 RepID=A0AAN9ANS6_9CAEN
MANEGEEDQPRKGETSEEASASKGTADMPLFNSTSEFSSMCKSLSTPVDIQKKAEGVLETLLSELDQQEEIEMSQKDMFVCALYMALVDARMPYGPHDPQLKHGYLAAPPVTITQLLQAANTSVKQLLQKMRQVKEMLLPSEAVTQHLTMLEKNFCVMSFLAHTFDRLCAGVFREEDKPHLESNEENIPSLPETEGVAFRRKLCWLLFIHAKSQVMGDNLDLLHGYLVLLCCLEYVMRTTPSFLLNSPYDVIRIGCLHTAEYGTMPMLAKICQQFGANQEETENLCTNCMEPFFQEVNSDGELDLDRLEEGYLKQHASDGDINEVLFLTKDPIVSPSTSRSNTPTNTGQQTEQPPMTPVRATLNSIQQLKNTLASATDEPSQKLKDYFQICTNNPVEAIADRVRRMRALFVSNFETATSPYQSVADPRFTLGVKLYYRMMELLLNNDSKRLSVPVLDTLLNKDNFHTSLLACSLEVVLVAYGLTRSYAVNGGDSEDSPFAFPWILETMNIQAYDFSKVLESFIYAEPRLPNDVVKHLQNIEYRILESLAWKEGSSLFDVIKVCERGQSTPPRNSPTDPLSYATNGQVCPSAAQMFLSPVPPRPGQSVASQLSVPQSVVPALPRRSQSLTSFFNKVYRLAYHRLQKLCTHLQINSDLLKKIWTCFENCVTYKPDILKNRHLDQILMCSVYGVCKVVEKDIRFKTIVQEYRNLPTAQPEVFRSVYMTESRYDSIINFYNQIFMVSMKSVILQFSSSNRQVAPTLSPVPHPVSPRPASPAYSVIGRKNFLVSPLKESPFKAPHSPSQLTPASRQLYCFGDRPGSSEKLRHINATVSAAVRRRAEQAGQGVPKEKVRRLIHFDQPPADDNQSGLNST